MNIVHISSSVFRIHGASKWLLLFTTTLEEKGHNNTIVCPRFCIPLPFWFKGSIQPLFKSKTKVREKSGFVKICSIFSQIATIIFLPIIIPRKTDVIVLHSEESLFAAVLSKILFPKAKLIYYCYQIPRELYDLRDCTKKTYGIWMTVFSPFIAVYKVLHKRLPRLADGVLVWSSQEIISARSLYGDLRFCVVPAGVDYLRFEITDDAAKKVEAFRNRLSLGKKKILLMNASLTKKKNIPEFLDLIYRLTHERQEIHGLIIGEGPEYGQLQDTVRRLGIEKSVTFLGYVAQEDLSTYYFLCDILFFIEFNPPWTMSIIEAAAAKKPVIVTTGGSIPTLVKDKETGYVVQDLADDLYQRTKFLLDDPRRCQEMGENNFQHCRPFSAEESVKNFLKMLENL
ncbi:MAG: glycosyltransferase family 4 protein [Candidatus Omnitrophota bacterium]